MKMLLDTIRVLDEVQHGMPTTTAQAFLLIASNPGIDLTRLAERMDLPKETVSSIVSRLKESKAGGVSLGLVKVEEEHAQRRSRPLVLTTKGKRLYTKLLATIPAARD